MILLTQSVATAVVEIILLLVGSALIGFLTAWFYQKSYYTPIIKKLEDEKAELTAKVENLNKEISSLNTKIGDLENIIAAKDKEIDELRNPKKQ